MIRQQADQATTFSSHRRRGVTMTEVLIAIMILGIGMTSLMTLFPIGLMKLRESRRNNRASLLAENVASDLKARDLLNRYSFAATYNATGLTGGTLFDAWSADYQALADPNNAANVVQMNPASGTGIPVVCCYDPLFFSNLAFQGNPAFTNPAQIVRPEFRFGRAFGNDIRLDPDGTAASAKGLPRLTNIWPALAAPDPRTGALQPGIGNINTVASIFVSQDDSVFPEFENQANTKVIATNQTEFRQSPVLPLIDNAATGSYSLNDWEYSWIFTGKARDRNIFEGDLVIFHKRQFGVNTDLSNNVNGIYGERVIEGIFGLGSIPMTMNNGRFGYAAGNSRKVLLMWPKITDSERPEIKVGGWIADVTYEPYLPTTTSRFLQDFDSDGRPDTQHGGQRCHWYRIVQKSEITDPGSAEPGLGGITNMEAIVVTVDRPVVAKTLLQKSNRGYLPVHVNAALIAPDVVSVFPITLEGK
jgi:prepilin-type N-terminal cleavage/methylation domain-containing protein